jgi:hypothetical protein
LAATAPVSTRSRRSTPGYLTSPDLVPPPAAAEAMSPNCNPHAERFVKTIKYECLNHFVFFGERHLRHVINEFMEHYLGERFHQGIGGQLVKSRSGPANDNESAGPIACRSRLGSLLNYYHREAA